MGSPNQRHFTGVSHGRIRLLLLPVGAFGWRSSLGGRYELGHSHLRGHYYSSQRVLLGWWSPEVHRANLSS